MFLVFVQIAVEAAAAVKSAHQTVLFEKQNHRSELRDVRHRQPAASLPCFTAVLPFALEGYELLSQYNFQYSTGADLLWHFNGLL